MSEEDQEFDYFLEVLIQYKDGQIENLLDSIFEFLSRKTDFHKSPSVELARKIVLEKFEKYSAEAATNEQVDELPLQAIYYGVVSEDLGLEVAGGEETSQLAANGNPADAGETGENYHHQDLSDDDTNSSLSVGTPKKRSSARNLNEGPNKTKEALVDENSKEDAQEPQKKAKTVTYQTPCKMNMALGKVKIESDYIPFIKTEPESD